MSVVLRTQIEKNLKVIQKHLDSIGGDDTELKALETRLKSEKDEFVKHLIAEQVVRLKRAKAEPSPAEQYKTDLTNVQKYLTAAHSAMTNIPWYQKSTRGGKRKKK